MGGLNGLLYFLVVNCNFEKFGWIDNNNWWFCLFWCIIISIVLLLGWLILWMCFVVKNCRDLIIFFVNKLL